MVGALAHRGPDDSGQHVEATHGVCLNHARLSILDLTPTGHQPMACATGRWVLVFNGEIYNHHELRQSLAPHAWRGHSDTEVLVEALDRWGPGETLRRLTGMFAIAAWDRHEQRLWLARDRAGEKPLYYGQAGGHFAFGSELKALAAVGGRPGFEPQALAAYLRHGYVPAPWSMMRGVRKLPPGHVVCIDHAVAAGGTARPEAYWDAMTRLTAARDQRHAGDDTAYETAVEDALRRSVRAQMVADVPVGAFLSGGIDSSLVVALMQQESSQPVRTFTIGFEDPDLNEAPWAAEVARHLGTAHTELIVSDAQMRSVVPRLASIYDEPFADSSQIPTVLVSALARQHVKVCLSGDGGDELFAGYTRYGAAERRWMALNRLPGPLRRRGAAAVQAMPAALWRTLGAAAGAVRRRPLRRPLEAMLQERALLARSANLVSMYRQSVSHWPDPGALAAAGPGADESAWPRLSELAANGGMALSPIEVFTLADTLTYLPDDILVKVDRASMAHSLELRAPLLDWELMELAWQSPVHMRRDKRVLKSLVLRHIPRALIERPKRGFGVPLAAWLRGPLREWADDLLGDATTRRLGLVAPGPVTEHWRQHRAGQADWSYRLWIVLMLHQWALAGESHPPAAVRATEVAAAQ